MSVALTMDTTGSTSAGDTLLTQALLTELSSLCRVKWKKIWRWSP